MNSKKKMVRLNLGCGTNIAKDFVNADLVPPPNADKSFIEANILELPFEKETFDYILCDQVLEHLPTNDVIPALYEIRRVLKKGGQAIILVPDFEDAARQWLSVNHNEYFNPLIHHYLSEVIYGNQQHEGEFHKTAMTAGYLNFCLRVAGLSNHQLVIYPHNGPLPTYAGVRGAPPTAVCRNAQLVAEITK